MGKIPQNTLEQIAAANDIVEVIGSYFPLKRAGSTYKALCPFHQEKSPSFTVNPQRQIFKCFGCGAGGSVFKFVELYENLSFPEAAKKLAERVGIKIVEEQLSEEDDRRFQMRRRLLSLHQEAAEWFHRNLLKTPAAQAARDYLKSRGITGEVAKSWKIGYAPDSWDALGNWAREQGYSVEELIASGLVKISETGNRKSESEEVSSDEDLSAIRNPQSAIRFYDRFRDRVMFPICNDIGEVIAFSGRVLKADAPEAKYVNSPETMLFTKGNVLFGLHKSKRALIDKNSAIVCEGQLDLITAFEAGVQNVIAPQGTAFTEKQARILKRYVEEVVLCFDSDAAGQKAAERSLASLLDANLFVRVAEMPAGHDPDSLIREQGAEAFAAQIASARDFFDYQIDRNTSSPEFATARGKMQFARKMAAAVSYVTDAVMKEDVINKVTARLGISAKDFRAMLNAPRREAEKTTDPKSPVVKPNTTIRLLCLAALRSKEAREWLLAQSWRELLSNNPEADLLCKVLAGDFQPDETNSVNAFLPGLSSDEGAFLSSLLLDKLPPNALVVAQDCWRDLQRREIKRRQEALSSRLRLPNLPMNEVVALQKEILDLQKHLTDIARPFSSPP